MGVLALGSVHARPSARPPIDTSGIFSATCVCRVTFKHLPQPLRSHIRSFGTIKQLLKFSKKKTLKNLKTIPQGWSRIFFGG